MELKFLSYDENIFWVKVFNTFLSLKYGYDNAIKYADDATLEYRKRF